MPMGAADEQILNLTQTLFGYGITADKHNHSAANTVTISIRYHRYS